LNQTCLESNEKTHTEHVSTGTTGPAARCNKILGRESLVGIVGLCVMTYREGAKDAGKPKRSVAHCPSQLTRPAPIGGLLCRSRRPIHALEQHPILVGE
jgi:hypothetical protein